MKIETLLTAAGILIVLSVTVWYIIRSRKMASWNYDWYKREFPELVTNGRVSCYRCKSSDLGVERMMNKTYMRAHICRQCGTTLYYSSEA